MTNETPNPKLMAKSLRASLAAQGIETSHSACLEMVARQWGYPDWNTLSASLQPSDPAQSPNLVIPTGWQISGTQAQDYRIGVSPDEPGSPARIISTKPSESPAAFATLMQSIEAAHYVSNRVMLEAEIRSFDTTGYVTIWMRVDDVSAKTLSFDNMELRNAEGTISGTQGWSKRQIILEVPKTAESIHFGFFLKGDGHGEARGFALSQAPADATTTSFGGNRLPEPMNLNFAERSLRV